MSDAAPALPHAPPYVLLDAILEARPDTCRATAPAPDDPALLIEVCAQACAAAAASASGAPRAGLLLGVKGFVIARRPRTGEPLRAGVVARGRTADGAIFRATIEDADGALVASGDLFLALRSP